MKTSRFALLEIGFSLFLILAPAAFGSVYPWAVMSLCALLFLMMAVYPQAIQCVRFVPRFFLLGILSVFCFIVFQYFFWSLNRDETVFELLKWMAAACGFLLIQLLPRRSIRNLLGVLIAAGFLESLYGIFQVETSIEKVLWRAKTAHLGFVTGTYFNRNHFAGFLELSLGTSLGYWWPGFSHKSLIRIVSGALSVIIMAAAFAKTGSRLGLLSFGISFVLLAAIFFKSIKKAPPVFLILAALSSIGIFYLAARPLGMRFQDIASRLQGWDGERLLVWHDTLRMVRNYPLLGTGLGTFEWVFPYFQSEQLFLGWAHAHHDYLELTANLGIPAALILILSFALLWRIFLIQIQLVPSSEFPLLWGILLSVTSLAIHGMGDFNWAIPANAFLFIFLMAAALRLLRPEVETCE